MANIIADLTARIESRRAETQVPCKNYATEAAAEKATEAMAKMAGRWFDKNQTPARYVVFYNAAWGRWVGALDLQELLQRNSFTGGAICAIAHKGWFTY